MFGREETNDLRLSFIMPTLAVGIPTNFVASGFKIHNS